MELTKTQWLDALNTFFKDCFRFWLAKGLPIEDCKRKAKAEMMVVQHFPFSPNGEDIPSDIKAEFIKRLDLV